MPLTPNSLVCHPERSEAKRSEAEGPLSEQLAISLSSRAERSEVEGPLSEQLAISLSSRAERSEVEGPISEQLAISLSSRAKRSAAEGPMPLTPNSLVCHPERSEAKPRDLCFKLQENPLSSRAEQSGVERPLRQQSLQSIRLQTSIDATNGSFERVSFTTSNPDKPSHEPSRAYRGHRSFTLPSQILLLLLEAINQKGELHPMQRITQTFPELSPLRL
jgi:hypothetical protein